MAAELVCDIRYVGDPEIMEEFVEYAQIRVALTGKCRGVCHGFVNRQQ
jgi:hypothetical protein